MRRQFIVCFGFLFLFLTGVSAETYESKHFIIHSDLDPRFVQFIQTNAEAFYENMVGRYFKTGGKRLTIYYSKTQSETFQLLRKQKHKTKAHKSYYIIDEEAVYTYRVENKGGVVDIGVLFHEITHHFVRSNFKDPPVWFNEGLACFFGDETHIVKGNVELGKPNPWREIELKERVEKGIKPNLKRLFPMTQEQLYNWPIGYNFSRALFYWLYKIGKLEQYLQNVQSYGYDISVLEQTVHKPVNEINEDLLAFIQKDCYAGAYLREGQKSRDEVKKQEAFLKAIELKPNYRRAELELALCFYRNGDYKQCRTQLQNILRFPESSEYRDAAEYMGHCYYREGNYAEALEYYEKSLEHADYYEYKYYIYYWIANCYHYIKDYETAKKFHKMFLEGNWEPENSPKQVAYAKEYQKRSTEEEIRSRKE
jgi:hypothetical protein